MIWEIEKKNDIYWYSSDVCQLKININRSSDCCVRVNYHGFNIIMPMELWGFDEEVTERGIDYNIEGESIEDWYFVVKKEDLRIFIDMIYFFIKENDAEQMIEPNLAIKAWN